MYSRRDDNYRTRMLGMIAEPLPIYIENIQEYSDIELFEKIKNSMNEGIENKIYKYFSEETKFGIDDKISFIYQGDNYNAPEIAGEKTFPLKLKNSFKHAQNVMDICITKNNNNYHLFIIYRSSWYEKKTIKNLCKIFDTICSSIVSKYL